MEKAVNSKVEGKITDVKLGLIASIKLFKKENEMTQKRMSKIAGVSQPRMSDILNNRVEKVRIDHIVRVMARLGLDIRV